MEKYLTGLAEWNTPVAGMFIWYAAIKFHMIIFLEDGYVGSSC